MSPATPAACLDATTPGPDRMHFCDRAAEVHEGAARLLEADLRIALAECGVGIAVL